MNRRKVLPEVKGGAERERVRERSNRVRRKQKMKGGLVMCRAVAVGGGDLPNEGEIGRRQQCEGEGRGGWKTNEYRVRETETRRVENK